MALYRFKVVFEEFDDVQRIIDIKSNQTFEDLHIAIQEAIGFDKSQLASFYFSDDTWKKGQEITLEDMSDDGNSKIPIMSKSRLCDLIYDPHQKFVYVFDFMEMWTFLIELVSISTKEDPKIKYPSCVRSVGVAPKQHDKSNRFGIVDENEFDEITKNYLLKSDELPGEIAESSHDDMGMADGESESEEDEFGSDSSGFTEDDEKY